MSKFFRRVIFRALGFSNRATMGQNVYVNPMSHLNKYVIIGDYTRINGPCYIMGLPDAVVKIGKYSAIGHGFRVRARNHNIGFANVQDFFQNQIGAKDLTITKGAVTIGNNVWIGDNVIVLSGVDVGDGAIIGAGSVVTKDVAPFSIHVGVPNDCIGNRFSEAVKEYLLELKWWDKSFSELNRNRNFFDIEFSKYHSKDMIMKEVEGYWK